MGYLGLSLKNQQAQNAVSLLLQVLEAMPQALRDLHPGHRTVMEAYLYDTALSVAYYVHSDNGLAQKAETFFTQASERYKKLGHTVRFAKCCCRYASFLAVRQHYHEGEYFLQQALNALKSLPPNLLSVVASHNLAVLTGIQNRMPDALVHMRTYQALGKQLPRLSNAWMQPLDNTQDPAQAPGPLAPAPARDGRARSDIRLGVRRFLRRHHRQGASTRILSASQKVIMMNSNVGRHL